MFHLMNVNLTLDLLTEKMICIPLKLVFCFNRTFVPLITHCHQLSNFRFDVWIRP